MGCTTMVSPENTPISSDFNVLSYGAIGDGETDDSEAFLKTWNEACKFSSPSKMIIPVGRTFLLYPVTFSGPCKSPLTTVSIMGNIVAPPSILPWKKSGKMGRWLHIRRVSGLHIYGHDYATIHGSGHTWWPHMCGENHSPVLSLFSIEHLLITGLSIMNSPQVHLAMYLCKFVDIKGMKLDTPGDTANTDGIKISHSQHVTIRQSVIGVGDDCIAMLTGTSDVNISTTTCGPGHGISIGSLGKGAPEDIVEDVRVTNISFIGSTNGARIKTWQGGAGLVRNILFENLTFTDVANPIIINQYYCNGHRGCKNQTSSIKISKIKYVNLHGTSSRDVAITLACCSVACHDIVLNDVNLTIANPKPGETATSYCLNVHGLAQGVVNPPVPCLS
ncbi:hypothetical protein AMTRI_Chr05g63520 [Amborella trichopoda]